MVNIRTFSLQRFKGTESISKVSEQVKNVKLNEDKPKETKSEETLDEVRIEYYFISRVNLRKVFAYSTDFS